MALMDNKIINLMILFNICFGDCEISIEMIHLLWVEALKRVNWLDTVDPFVLLLSGGCWDAVEGVIAFHHTSVGLRLAGLYHLVFIIWDEKLKAIL